MERLADANLAAPSSAAVKSGGNTSSVDVMDDDNGDQACDFGNSSPELRQAVDLQRLGQVSFTSGNGKLSVWLFLYKGNE